METNLNDFEIKILRSHWVKDDGEDDPSDLCSHGEIYVRIGKEIVCDANSGSWTTSAAALFLLRTAESDFQPEDSDNQLIPCCGHSFVEGESQVHILTCPNGINWSVKHLAHHTVLLTTARGEQVEIDLHEYKSRILNFSLAVHQFYFAAAQKILPNDDHDKAGYLQFINEWNTRIEKLKESLLPISPEEE